MLFSYCYLRVFFIFLILTFQSHITIAIPTNIAILVGSVKINIKVSFILKERIAVRAIRAIKKSAGIINEVETLPVFSVLINRLINNASRIAVIKFSSISEIVLLYIMRFKYPIVARPTIDK